MSTLTVTTIKTIDNVTDFTAQSGNTSAGKIVVSSNSAGITLQGNSASSGNSVYVTGSGFLMGSSSANTVVNSSYIAVSRSTTNLQLTTSTFFVGNSISNTSANSTQITTSILSVGNTISVGNSVSNSIVNSSFMSIGSYSNAASGYTILPGGFKMNWGVVVANSVGQNVITYANSFTTNTYTLSFTVAGSGAAVLKAFANASTITNSGVTVLTGNATALNNTSITSVYYMAIGPA